MSDKTCSNCGSSIQDDARFCPSCGLLTTAPIASALPVTKPCPHCGASNPRHTQVCERCGKSFLKKPRKLTCAILLGIAGVLGAITICSCAILATVVWSALFPDLDQDEQLVQVPSDTTPSVGIKLGQIAPDFTLSDSNGGAMSLYDLRGKPIIINFWASWCGPCRSEMPDLDALYQEASSQHDLVVLAVNTSDSDRTGAEAFIQNKQLTFPVLWDAQNRVNNRYNIRAFPTSFFIDRNGIIRAIRIGSMKRSDMDERAKLIY